MRFDLNSALALLLSSEERVRQIRTSLVEATGEDVALVRQSFVSNLGADWSRLSSEFGALQTGAGLQRHIQSFEEFLARLQNIVLQPRRSLVAQQLDKWLEDWSAGRVASLEYLRDADDAQMAEIEEILAQAESPKMKDGIVQKVAQDWLRYWVSRLKTQEKRAEIMITWLQDVDQGLYTTRLYANEFLGDQVGAAIEQATQPLLRRVYERWLNERRHVLRQRNFKVDDLEMEKLKEDDESDWGELQGALHALGLALHDCSVAEQRLIERTITDWESISPSHVQSLVDSLSAVARTKLRYMSSAERFTTGVSYEPVSEDVTELVHWRPVLPDLTDMSTLVQMIDAYDQLVIEMDAWEKEFTEVMARVQRDAHRWDRAPLPDNLRDQIALEDVLQNDIETLADLVATDAKVVALNQQVRESIEQSLSSAERELWEKLNEHQARGEARLDVLSLAAQLDGHDFLEALWGLNEKRFIHMEVIL